MPGNENGLTSPPDSTYGSKSSKSQKRALKGKKRPLLSQDESPKAENPTEVPVQPPGGVQRKKFKVAFAETTNSSPALPSILTCSSEQAKNSESVFTIPASVLDETIKKFVQSDQESIPEDRAAAFSSNRPEIDERAETSSKSAHIAKIQADTEKDIFQEMGDAYEEHMTKGMPAEIAKKVSLALANLARCYRGDVEDYRLWHRRLNHILDYKVIKRVCPHITCPPLFHCHACAQAKIQSHSFSKNNKEDLEDLDPGQRLNIDSKDGYVPTPGGNTGRTLYTCAKTGFTVAEFWRKRDEQVGAMKSAFAIFHALTGKWPRMIKVDGAKEFLQWLITELLLSLGCIRKIRGANCPNTAPSAEGMERIVVDGSLAQMIQSCCPSNLWAESESCFLWKYAHCFFVVEKLEDGTERPTSRINQMRGKWKPFNHDYVYSFGIGMYAYIPKPARTGGGALKRKCHMGVFTGMVWNSVKMARCLILKTRSMIEVPLEYCVMHEGISPFKACPRTTLEQNLPPLYFDPDGFEDDNMQEIGALMDPEVDDDFYRCNPDMVDDDGHRVRLPGKRRKGGPRDEMDEKHDSEEEDDKPPPKRSRTLSSQALRNIPDRVEEGVEERDAQQPFPEGGR